MVPEVQALEVDNVPVRLRQHALRQPAAPFCTFLAAGTAQTMTFGELYERSAAYARQIQARGLGPGDLVLVMLDHSPHQYYAFLGAMLAGAVPSFMPPPSAK